MLEYEDELSISADCDLLCTALEFGAAFNDPARLGGPLLRVEVFLDGLRLLWKAFPGRRATLSMMLGSLSSRMSDNGLGTLVVGAGKEVAFGSFGGVMIWGFEIVNPCGRFSISWCCACERCGMRFICGKVLGVIAWTS